MTTYDVYRDDERKCSVTTSGLGGELSGAVFAVSEQYGPGVYTAVERPNTDERMTARGIVSSLADTEPELRTFQLSTEWLEDEE